MHWLSVMVRDIWFMVFLCIMTAGSIALYVFDNWYIWIASWVGVVALIIANKIDLKRKMKSFNREELK